MQENGFWEGTTVKSIKVGEILAQKTDFPSLIAVSPRDTLSKATNYLQKLNISQLPVIDNNHVVGSVNEASLMKFLHDGINFSKQEVSAVMGKPLPMLDEEVDISEAYRVLLSGTTGIIIKRNDVPIGLITRADLIRYWISQTQESLKENHGI
ncbi:MULTISPECIES: CBS domain-containing protein [unclassified Nostoc]|nr:CBS domain-containing protein [Nostoc sp. S13]MDF5738506.1 CBS domain-containing protein [Nostoc sp. S13]